MNKAEAEAVVLRFADQLRAKGSWCGETHMQKAGFFLQQLTEVPIPGHFRLWKHGPYSFDLKDQILELVGYGLLEVRANSFPYGPTLVVTERGRRHVECHHAIVAQHDRQIEFITGQLAGKGVVALEKLGTALLVTKEMPGATVESRAQELTRLKPHVPLPEALQAVRELDQMWQAWTQ